MCITQTYITRKELHIHPIVQNMNERGRNHIGGTTMIYATIITMLVICIIGAAFISWRKRRKRPDLANALIKEWGALEESERRERIQLVQDVLSRIDKT